jgi:hypothetical protein
MPSHHPALNVNQAENKNLAAIKSDDVGSCVQQSAVQWTNLAKKIINV